MRVPYVPDEVLIDLKVGGARANHREHVAAHGHEIEQAAVKRGFLAAQAGVAADLPMLVEVQRVRDARGDRAAFTFRRVGADAAADADVPPESNPRRSIERQSRL